MRLITAMHGPSRSLVILMVLLARRERKTMGKSKKAVERRVEQFVGTIQCPCCSRRVNKADAVGVKSIAEDGHVTQYTVCRECAVKDLF